MIRYSVAKRILSRYAGIGGTCDLESEELDLFVKEVLQYMLMYGTYGNERKFCFQAQNGCITLPYELETPLKIKIDGVVGSVWNRWFEYHSGNNLEGSCLANEALLTEANRYATVFDGPSCGFYPAILGHCCEDDDAHVVVKGEDTTGREIYTIHLGEQIVGERLNIRKGVLTRSQVLFGNIREVACTKTQGYKTLYATDKDGNSRQFLADYGPFETNPSYQRARIISQPCPPICGVTVLGRIRLKDHYADDDVIPFDNILLLRSAGQTINDMYTDRIQAATARDGFVEKLIEKENNFKKVNNGQPVEVFQPLSAGMAMGPQRAACRLRRAFYGRGWFKA